MIYIFTSQLEGCKNIIFTFNPGLPEYIMFFVMYVYNVNTMTGQKTGTDSMQPKWCKKKYKMEIWN